MIQVEGIFSGGSDSPKSYTLEIKTKNPNSNVDYVFFYYYDESGRHKNCVYLTTSYQTITFCDGFLAVYRGSGNVVSYIDLFDSNGNRITSVVASDPYGIWVASTGYMVLNMAYLFEEYPNLGKMSFGYMD